MQVKSKTKSYLYFDEGERKLFNVWLAQNNMSQEEAAKRLHVSETYLSLVLNGKRVLTDKMIDKFTNIGFTTRWIN